MKTEIDNMIATTINGKSITVAELRSAFEMVCDSSNWKNPIDVRIDNPGDHMLEVIKDAVMYFAGCTAYFRPHEDTVHVTAKGYYLAIGA
jgi:hypothetical protein